MKFDDISYWAGLLEEEEQTKAAEDAAYAASQRERAEKANSGFNDIDQSQIELDELFAEGESAEKDEIFEEDELPEGEYDLGEAFDDDPLVNALDPIKSSSANLAAQDVVQATVVEALKKLTDRILPATAGRCWLKKLGKAYALMSENGTFLPGTKIYDTLEEACRAADDVGAGIENLAEEEEAADSVDVDVDDEQSDAEFQELRKSVVKDGLIPCRVEVKGDTYVLVGDDGSSMPDTTVYADLNRAAKAADEKGYEIVNMDEMHDAPDSELAALDDSTPEERAERAKRAEEWSQMMYQKKFCKKLERAAGVLGALNPETLAQLDSAAEEIDPTITNPANDGMLFLKYCAVVLGDAKQEFKDALRNPDQEDESIDWKKLALTNQQKFSEYRARKLQRFLIDYSKEHPDMLEKYDEYCKRVFGETDPDFKPHNWEMFVKSYVKSHPGDQLYKLENPSSKLFMDQDLVRTFAKIADWCARHFKYGHPEEEQAAFDKAYSTLRRMYELFEPAGSYESADGAKQYYEKLDQLYGVLMQNLPLLDYVRREEIRSRQRKDPDPWKKCYLHFLSPCDDMRNNPKFAQMQQARAEGGGGDDDDDDNKNATPTGTLGTAAHVNIDPTERLKANPIGVPYTQDPADYERRQEIRVDIMGRNPRDQIDLNPENAGKHMEDPTWLTKFDALIRKNPYEWRDWLKSMHVRAFSGIKTAKQDYGEDDKANMEVFQNVYFTPEFQKEAYKLIKRYEANLAHKTLQQRRRDWRVSQSTKTATGRDYSKYQNLKKTDQDALYRGEFGEVSISYLIKILDGMDMEDAADCVGDFVQMDPNNPEWLKFIQRLISDLFQGEHAEWIKTIAETFEERGIKIGSRRVDEDDEIRSNDDFLRGINRKNSLTRMTFKDLNAKVGLGSDTGGESGGMTEFEDKFVNYVLWLCCVVAGVDCPMIWTQEQADAWMTEYKWLDPDMVGKPLELRDGTAASPLSRPESAGRKHPAAELGRCQEISIGKTPLFKPQYADLDAFKKGLKTCSDNALAVIKDDIDADVARLLSGVDDVVKRGKDQDAAVDAGSLLSDKGMPMPANCLSMRALLRQYIYDQQPAGRAVVKVARPVLLQMLCKELADQYDFAGSIPTAVRLGQNVDPRTGKPNPGAFTSQMRDAMAKFKQEDHVISPWCSAGSQTSKEYFKGLTMSAWLWVSTLNDQDTEFTGKQKTRKDLLTAKEWAKFADALKFRKNHTALDQKETDAVIMLSRKFMNYYNNPSDKCDITIDDAFNFLRLDFKRHGAPDDVASELAQEVVTKPDRITSELAQDYSDSEYMSKVWDSVQRFLRGGSDNSWKMYRQMSKPAYDINTPEGAV